VRRSTSTILAAPATLTTFTYSPQRGHQTLSPRTRGGCVIRFNRQRSNNKVPASSALRHSAPTILSHLILSFSICLGRRARTRVSLLAVEYNRLSWLERSAHFHEWCMTLGLAYLGQNKKAAARFLTLRLDAAHLVKTCRRGYAATCQLTRLGSNRLLGFASTETLLLWPAPYLRRLWLSRIYRNQGSEKL